MHQDTRVIISRDKGIVMKTMSRSISSYGKSIAVLGVAVVVSIVAACGVFRSEDTPLTADVSVEVSQPRDWGPMAVVRDTTLGSLDAQVGYGTLRIAANCVILEELEPSSPLHLVTIVWKSGRSGWLDPTKQIYSITGSAQQEEITLSDGDIISIGGGEGPADIEDVEWIQRPHPDCPTELVWAGYVSVEPR